ncbi:MAG: addiction module antidote protein [Proteobacteria bacterium]|nr:addiction module antidote protein [Pseudomonadota bacterium]
MLDQLFAPPPRLSDLTVEQAMIVRAIRQSIAAQRHRRVCPLQAAATQLGSDRASHALHILLAGIASAWPDPFAVAPPCCPHLTHDESTLLGMVIAARSHGRPVFDALICEMLAEDARDRLFAAATALGEWVEA